MSSPEERLLVFARTRGHAPAAERAVARFSALGEHGALWLAIGAVGWALDRPRRPRWRRAAGAVGAAYVANTAIKVAVKRRRPVLEGLPPLASTPTQLSFPSAHTATAFAGARAYSQLGLPSAPLYLLALATGISRLYLGLHHPSDVLAGAALGLAVAEAAGHRPAGPRGGGGAASAAEAAPDSRRATQGAPA